MKYSKPQIINTTNAAFAIMNVGGKVSGPSDNAGNNLTINPAYSDDE
jgi:hypothetical protein